MKGFPKEIYNASELRPGGNVPREVHGIRRPGSVGSGPRFDGPSGDGQRRARGGTGEGPEDGLRRRVAHAEAGREPSVRSLKPEGHANAEGRTPRCPPFLIEKS